MYDFRAVGVMFVILGTCVGAGMLALPVVGAEIGFLPSISVMFATYLLMALGGLFYLEIALWFDEETHLISISKKYLGNAGKWLTIVTYILIAYATLVAYSSEGARMLSDYLDKYFHIPLDYNVVLIIYLCLVSFVLLAGTRLLSITNAFCIALMGGSYLFLLAKIGPYLDNTLLFRSSWHAQQMTALFPVMLSSFSYPGIVPAVVHYLDKDVKRIRWAILWGTSLAFVIYSLWLAMVYGVIPYNSGIYNLKDTFEQGYSAVTPLQAALGTNKLSIAANFFGFFAVTTSFIGLGFGLVKFFADGFNMSYKLANRPFLIGLVALPVFFAAITYPGLFLIALEVTGGIGDALISICIPAVIILVAKYHFGQKISPHFYLDNRFIYGLIAYGVYQIITEVIHLLG